MQIETLFTGIANTHIVQDSNGVMVIDAGMPHQARRIVGKIKAMGHSPQEVRLILVTHGHIDHAGSAVALKRLTGAPIALHRSDAPLVATPDLKIPPGRRANIDAFGRLLTRFGWVVPQETFAPDVLLEDGQSLRDFGFDACIVHTPGHTAGSVSVDFGEGTLFVGDALLNLVRVSFPLWWESSTQAYASAHTIQALRPRLCYTGHGQSFDRNALDQFIAKIEQRQAQA